MKIENSGTFTGVKYGWLICLTVFLGLSVQASVEPENPVRPVLEKARWRLVWSDEFSGPDLDTDPTCFTRIPQCLFGSSKASPRNCPKSTWTNLSLLNKCHWSVLSFYNPMDQGAREGEGINAFDPNEVIVRDGELILKSQARGRQYVDCGRTLEDLDEFGNRLRTNDCAFISGGVTSRPFGESPHKEGSVHGLTIKYGRVEIRARLPQGPGNWPKYWMLPLTGSWPADGEIDLMERKVSHPWRVSGSLHGGEEDSSVHIQSRHYLHAWQSFFLKYHVYAVEWSPHEIRYYVDQTLIGITREGELTLDPVTHRKIPIHIPDRPFYLILSSTIAPFSQAPPWFHPNPSDFTPQDHHIDYVRVFEPRRSPD